MQQTMAEASPARQAKAVAPAKRGVFNTPSGAGGGKSK